MFERFAEDARLAVTLAQQRARTLGHASITTGHLVLGVLDADPGRAAAGLLDRLDANSLATASADEDLDAHALATVGIDLDAVRERVEGTFGRGALAAPPTCRRGRRRLSDALAFSPRAKRALEGALREALVLGSGEIRSEHVLLGVLWCGDGVGARELVAAGVDRAALLGALDAPR
jgi:ATP-dependent Clp protease ATP-binding subunit ClpA